MQKLYDIRIGHISGHQLFLNDFKNKVLLIVNVASKCGFTNQYAGLQQLYELYQPHGFEIIAVPCNQFGAQEPGDAQTIRQFCHLRYATTFTLSEKIEVNGPRRHPLYKWLVGEESSYPGDVSWNFEKFMISRQGKLIARFPSKTEPTSQSLVTLLELALKSDGPDSNQA